MRLSRPSLSASAAPLLIPVVAALAFLADPDPAAAGPNAGGVLVLHRPQFLPPECTGDIADYCPCNRLERCEDAITRRDGSAELSIIFAIMAFPDGANPRVSSARFGLEYDASTILLLGLKHCASAEEAMPAWPGSGSGTIVSFDQPATGRLQELYWFAAYEYYGPPRQLALRPHPTLGGAFTDDSTPAVEDPIVDYGAFGFNMDGRLPCPSPVGACCLADGDCVLLDATRCAEGGGTYLGDGASCEPNPCEPTPVGGESWGRVKSRFRP